MLYNSSKSFDDIDLWIKDLKENASPDIRVFLIGNKADLEDSRLITKEQGSQLQKDFDLDLFMETSAKTGFNAEELFIEGAKLLFKDYNQYKKTKKKDTEKEKLKLDNESKNKGKGCC
jgi:GTPase SAR1 family protein